MERKSCVLFYSKHSRKSNEIISYIQNLSFDLPMVTGLSIMSVDNDVVKKILSSNEIYIVPVLVINYFDGTRQIIEDDEIYEWVNFICKEISKPNQQSPQVSQFREVSRNEDEKPKEDSFSDNTTEEEMDAFAKELGVVRQVNKRGVGSSDVESEIQRRQAAENEM
ncbi:142R [Cherax quadricarinatus iridovirus]|uniref:Inactivated thioredoxin glutaredoxin n=1 Tax=Shrimp hemocyte iridescent virus TaxID=2039780 RepID=A0A291B0L0_9VIRU|nr:142R [Cherax quadricarinatus iridovirus]YP_010084766.1 inactivated thioredoxin glutaredoxin [Shrimp hemocyte iridescent virus]UPA43289.1 inactivated thioredoxin glutaredoxin [Iridovirus CN01]ASZ85122.1 142R [Cherax quadricarinatus iridovirus]ATE87023.1 inactivated thioredoxin glutaredoxin [Shrimp hemocyte iridescent virus]UPA43524.1 inactivated thioredoxin glutaredoxin [Iridovirus CN01]UPA43721.1 inactivated thioredoxin glutaredoxin [Iridovirus CN01]